MSSIHSSPPASEVAEAPPADADAQEARSNNSSDEAPLRVPDVRMRDASQAPGRAPRLKQSVGLIVDDPVRAAHQIEKLVYQVTRYFQQDPAKLYEQCRVWEINARSRFVLNYCKWNKKISDMSLAETCFVAMCYAYTAFTAAPRRNIHEAMAIKLHSKVRMITQEWRPFAAEYVGEMDALFDDVCSVICFKPVPRDKKKHPEVDRLFKEKKKSAEGKDEVVLRPPELDNATYLEQLKGERTRGDEDYNEARLLDELLKGEIGDSITDFHPDLMTDEEMLALAAMEKPMQRGEDAETEKIPRKRRAYGGGLEAEDTDSDFEDTEDGVNAMEKDEKGVVVQDGLRFDMDVNTNAITIHDTVQQEEKYKDFRLPANRKKLSLYPVESYSARAFVTDASRLFFWYEVRKQFLSLHEVIHHDVTITKLQEDVIWKGLTAAAQMEMSDEVQRGALEFFIRSEMPVGSIESFLRQRPMRRWAVSISDVLEHESSQAHHRHIIELRSRNVPLIMDRKKAHPMREAWSWTLWNRFFVSYLGIHFAKALPIKAAAVPPPKTGKNTKQGAFDGLKRAQTAPKTVPLIAPGIHIGETEEYDPTFFVFFDDIPERWDKILTMEKYDERRRPLVIAMDDVYFVQNIRLKPKKLVRGGCKYYRELHRCKDAITAIHVWINLMSSQFAWLFADGKSAKVVWDRFTERVKD